MAKYPTIASYRSLFCVSPRSEPFPFGRRFLQEKHEKTRKICSHGWPLTQTSNAIWKLGDMPTLASAILPICLSKCVVHQNWGEIMRNPHHDSCSTNRSMLAEHRKLFIKMLVFHLSRIWAISWTQFRPGEDVLWRLFLMQKQMAGKTHGRTMVKPWFLTEQNHGENGWKIIPWESVVPCTQAHFWSIRGTCSSHAKPENPLVDLPFIPMKMAMNWSMWVAQSSNTPQMVRSQLPW